LRYPIVLFFMSWLIAAGARGAFHEPRTARYAEPMRRVSCSREHDAVEPALRVMTLNVAHGRSDGPNQIFLGRPDFEDNLSAVSELLRESRADIVALQEVDGPSRWSGMFDHAIVLARDASYPWHFRADHAASWLYRYGTAVLSRLPVYASRSHRFEATPPTPTKGLVVSEVRVPNATGTEIDIDVLSVHFDFLSERAKRRQLAELVDVLNRRGNATILLGDFNSTWDDTDSIVRELVGQTGLSAYEPESGQLATHGDARLDWILISDEFRFEDYRVLPDVVSDHQPVVADIGFKADDAPVADCRHAADRTAPAAS